MEEDVGTSRYWEGRYRDGRDNWELGGATAPLLDLLDRDPPRPRGGKVAVVGCGRGHDARLFARRGYEAWGFDFAPSVMEEARRMAEKEGTKVTFLEKDIFELPEEFPHFFDIIWEYTSYCAVHPARRDGYIHTLREILAPRGLLLALFFPVQDKEGGPPFSTTEEEIREVLDGRFRVLSMEDPSSSIKPRAGRERLVRAVPI